MLVWIIYISGYLAAWGITTVFSKVTGHKLEYRGSKSYAIAYLWSWMFAIPVLVALCIYLIRTSYQRRQANMAKA